MYQVLYRGLYILLLLDITISCLRQLFPRPFLSNIGPLISETACLFHGRVDGVKAGKKNIQLLRPFLVAVLSVKPSKPAWEPQYNDE